MSSALDWIAVDWGTSNLRAWGVGSDGTILFERSSPKGMGKLGRDEFAPALIEVLDGQLPSGSGTLDVLICGMAGAKQGWIEAPYLQAPADLKGLVQSAVRPAMPNASLNVAILPGVCQKDGHDNVMRGEETQLLGLSALQPGFSGLVCMPGTHSKWAELSGTRIEHFSTAMTGEMFEVLRVHSVLRHSLSGDLEGPEREEGFAAGAVDGLEHPEQLLSTLFRVRAGSLLSNKQPDWCAGYLSGLLIGTEVGSNRDLMSSEPIPLIGSLVLCNLYRVVLAMIGIEGQPQDSTETVLAGLKAARIFAA